MEYSLFIVLLITGGAGLLMTNKIDELTKEAKASLVEWSVIEILARFFNEHDYRIETILIEERILFQYRPRDRSLGIKERNSTVFFNILGALHEAGHYISINRSIYYEKLFIIVQNMVALNRLLIVPLIFIFLVIGSYEVVLFWLVYFFALATLLKVTIGWYEEFWASKKALDWIKKNLSNQMFKLAANFYRIAFISQAGLTVLMAIVVSIALYFGLSSLYN